MSRKDNIFYLENKLLATTFSIKALRKTLTGAADSVRSLTTPVL